MRILFASAVPPNSNCGGGRRTDLLLQSLARRGTVTTVALGPPWPAAARSRAKSLSEALLDLTGGEPLAPDKDLRQRLGPVDFRFHPWRRIRQRISALHASNPWDVVVHRYIHPFATLGPLPGATNLVDVDDLPSEVRSSAAPAWNKGPLRRPHALLTARRLASAERALLERATGLWVSAPTHARTLGREDAVLLPNALPWPSSDPQTPRTDRPPTALFIGPLWHAPNREGLAWLLAEVWPRVRRRLPDARLLMAGEGPTPLLTPNSGCDYLGFVPDAPGPGGLDALYQDCDLACAPLFSGSGTSIKVLEALGRGLPCLATPWAARHLDTGSAILRVREPEAWSDELVEMLHARRRLGARARRAAPEVRQSYGIQRFQGAVDQLLQLVRETVVG